jgi:two-component system NtrC family sensor kinase
MRTRIGAQIILGVGLVTALTIGILAVLILRAHRAALIAELQRSADQLSETIKSATLHDMLENRRDNLQRQIDTIGGQEGIRNVRIYNKQGRVVFSSDAVEVGRSVDKQAEACYACHAVGQPLTSLPIKARARVFRGKAGEHLLGIINPVRNQTSCIEASCHAHGAQDRVLGILDVTMPLAAVDRSIRLSQARMAGLTAAVIVASGLILFWLNRRLVVRPVESLAKATRRVAEGDLTTRIPVVARHELGELARAFNEMVARLAEDQRQIAQSDKLASVGRLAAGVAHEINNPLTGVLTYASFLLKRAHGNPELEQDLEVVVRETKRCREIVRGLLDFARQTPPRRQPADVNEVVRRAVAIVTNQVSLRRVELVLDLAEHLPELSLDANRMEQVFVISW